ncbi:hypothetical protein VTL71DRAFT_5853 [Oculimacula yallundae]|uniref:Uncharacterized protein n=1 Tax=Oculimacula yallundae TaxID=86028 RepID=A0ABR4BZU8_9HELO
MFINVDLPLAFNKNNV